MNKAAEKRPVVRQDKKDNRIARAKARFLQALREMPNISSACELARVSRSYIYEQRDRDAAIRAEWNAALDKAVDAVEATPYRLAMEGNPQLIQFLLKAHRKAVYGDAPRTDLASPTTVHFSTRYVAVHDNGANE